MSDDIKELKRAWRDIEAPPHLATRIRAEVADRPARSRPWVPAAVTMAVLSALILPFLSQGPTNDTPPPPTRPSMSALASLTPSRPPVRAPNLSQLRSVRTPKMPAKPRIRTQRPQSNLDTESELYKENDHADV